MDRWVHPWRFRGVVHHRHFGLLGSGAVMRAEHLAEGITVYCGDAKEIVPTLQGIDAVVTDPPYGIAHSGDSGRFSGGNTRRGPGSTHGSIKGDDKPFDPSPFLVGRTQIIWGFNNFPQHLSPGSLLVWSKRRPFAYGSFLSDGEVAWFSRGRGVYLFEHIFSGSAAAVEYTADAYAKSAHPFQKPIAVMEWCIGKLPAEARTILDPFMGSGTTGVAAVKMRRQFVGIEIEPRYFDIACKRISEALRQPSLFTEPPAPAPKQEELGFRDLRPFNCCEG